MCHGPTNGARDGTKWRASPRPTGPHAVTHPLPPRLVIFSHPHIPTQTPHTQKYSRGASIHSPSRCHIRLSLSRPLSFLVLSLPRRPLRPLYPCLSRIRNTHTYLSRPCQMHQLHIHTCYITYPIDLKSPLFMSISHTTFLLNKVWPKNILEFLHIYNITKLYGGVWTLALHGAHNDIYSALWICIFLYYI